MQIVYFWQDGTWCYKDEYSIAGYSWKSDDIGVLELSMDLSDAAVDHAVQNKVNN